MVPLNIKCTDITYNQKGSIICRTTQITPKWDGPLPELMAKLIAGSQRACRMPFWRSHFSPFANLGLDILQHHQKLQGTGFSSGVEGELVT